MAEIIIAHKQKYIEDNYPFRNDPKLTDKKCSILIHF